MKHAEYTYRPANTFSIDEITLDRIIGRTANVIDAHTRLAAVAYGRARGCEPLAREMILERRRSWLAWLTVTQREYQGHTRNANKARHHDSIATREFYVRCHA